MQSKNTIRRVSMLKFQKHKIYMHCIANCSHDEDGRSISTHLARQHVHENEKQWQRKYDFDVGEVMQRHPSWLCSEQSTGHPPTQNPGLLHNTSSLARQPPTGEE